MDNFTTSTGIKVYVEGPSNLNHLEDGELLLNIENTNTGHATRFSLKEDEAEALIKMLQFRYQLEL